MNLSLCPALNRIWSPFSALPVTSAQNQMSFKWAAPHSRVQGKWHTRILCAFLAITFSKYLFEQFYSFEVLQGFHRRCTNWLSNRLHFLIVFDLLKNLGRSSNMWRIPSINSQLWNRKVKFLMTQIVSVNSKWTKMMFNHPHELQHFSIKWRNIRVWFIWVPDFISLYNLVPQCYNL